MKKLHTSFITCLLILSIISCKKEEEKTNNNSSTTTASFEWQENGGSKILADSAFWTTGTWGTGIRAYKGGTANFFEVNWSGNNNTTPGKKVISYTNYGFTFIKGGTTYNISSDQDLTITAAESNTLTGSFTISPVGGTITSIEAHFNILPKK
jgi:hypothetical protein